MNRNTQQNRLIELLLVALLTAIATSFIWFLFAPKTEQSAEKPILAHPNRSKNTAPTDNPTTGKPVLEAFRAVVQIKSQGSDNQTPSLGSGVIVHKDGYLITNYHVVKDGRKFEVVLFNRRVIKDVLLVGFDADTDLAVLKIPAGDYPVLSFSSGETLQEGDWVYAIGNPYGLNNTITNGIVSSLHRRINTVNIESFIQTDAVVNAGNSGGALLDTEGRLVGLISAIFTRSGTYEGYSFAIPTFIVSKVFDELVSHGRVISGQLDLSVSDISSAIADRERLANGYGVEVIGMPPKASSLQVGDILLSFNGNRIYNAEHYKALVYCTSPGESVVLDFQRNGKRGRVTVAALANRSPVISTAQPHNNIESLLGIQLEEMSLPMVKRFGRGGVLVSNIESGSIVGKANMDKHFVIQFVNRRSVTTVDQARRALETASNTVEVIGKYDGLREQYIYKFNKQ
jgi:serine protease Do